MTEENPQRRWWPPSPYDFADTSRCPACFTTISAETCPQCGLVLTDGRTAELLTLGQGIIETENRRQEALARIRLAQRSDAAAAPAEAPPTTFPFSWPAAAAHPETSATPPVAPATLPVAPDADAEERPDVAVAASAAASPVAPAVPSPTTAPAGVPAASDPAPPTLTPPAVTPPAAAPPTPVPPTPAEPPRRRLTVPVLLLIVGVSLVAVAAIFFLTLAWFFSDIGVRALIIGGVTLATIVVASVLRRRRLTMTAEGIAVLGVVLIGLDVWAVRANDLFGTGAVRPALYGGIGLLVAAVLFRVWARVSQLRAPDFAAVLALPAAVGLLAAGALGGSGSTAATAGFLGASVGALAHRLPAPLSAARAPGDAVLERTILAAIGVGALILAALSDLGADPGSMWTPVWLAPAVAILGVVHALTILRGAPLHIARPLAATALATGAVALGGAGWAMALRTDAAPVTFFVAPVLAVAVAVALLRIHRMPQLRALPLPAAVYAGLAVGGVSLVVALGQWLLRGGAHAADWIVWRTAPFATTGAAEALWIGAAAAVITALLLAVPAGLHPFVAVARPIVIAVVLLVGAFATGIPAAAVFAGIALAALGVILLARGARPRTGWVIAGALGAVTAYAAGVTHPGLWLAGIVTAVALPPVLGRVLRAEGAWLTAAVATPLGIATLSTLPAPAALAVTLERPSGGLATTLLLLQWLALVVLAVAVFSRSAAARRVLSTGGVALAGLAVLPLALALFAGALRPESGSVVEVIDRPVVGVIRLLILLGLLAVVAGNAVSPDFARGVRRGGAAFLAPTLAMIVLAVYGLVVGVRSTSPTAVIPAELWQAVLPAAAVVIAACAALVALAGALLSIRMPELDTVRGAADGGALAIALLAVPWADFTAFSRSITWLFLALLALGLGAASVCRGWRNPWRVVPAAAMGVTPGVVAAPPAPIAGTASDVADAASDAATRRFPWRRLLAWPAVLLLCVAWARGLDRYAPAAAPEAFVLPIAGLLLAFCIVLVWLRRPLEAAIAVVLSFLAGIMVLAVEGLSGTPTRAVIVALAAAAIVVAIGWSPARRVRFAATAGATTALAGGLVAVTRHVDAAATPELLWLGLPVAAAYLAGVGFAAESPASAGDREGAGAPRPESAPLIAATRIAEPSTDAPTPDADVPTAGANPVMRLLTGNLFAVVVAPIALGIATFLILPSIDRAAAVAGALIVPAAIHVASAWAGRAPFGAASRWTALGSALLVAVIALSLGDHRPIEVVTLPVAALTLAGAVAAITRHRRPDTEAVAWVVGLVLAILPSILAAEVDLRTWLVVGLGIAVAAAAASVRHPLALHTALVGSLGAIAMGARTLPDLAPALVAAAGAVLVGALLVQRQSDAGHLTLVPPLAGVTLGAVSAAIGEAGTIETTLVTAAATLVGMVGAWLLAADRWRGFGAVLAIGGAATAAFAIARRFSGLSQSAAVEIAVWPFVAALAVGLIGTVALVRSRERAVWTGAGIVFALGTLALAGGELRAIEALSGGAAQLVALVTVSALSAAAVAGFVFRSRLGLTLVIAASGAVVVFALLALGLGIRPVELLTVPPALGLLALGARTLRREPVSRSWPTLGPGLALLTIPSLLHDLGPSALWRVVALGLVAVALVVLGATRKLQAPLILGAVVLLIHAVAQLWPWIASAYTAVPWWLWAGAAGILLIYVALRYERQKVAMRKAFVAVTSLR